MTAIELKEELLPYPENDLEEWIKSEPHMIRTILPKKLSSIKESLEDRKKHGSRYFAEANVARMWEPNVTNGWYGSYSWLGSSRWSKEDFRPSGEQWQKKHKKEFHNALKSFITLEVIRELQEVAAALSKKIHMKVRKGPDLFFITKDGRLEFVEAKHEDTVKDHQIASLALLKRCLNASVRIVRVYPVDLTATAVDQGNFVKVNDYTDKFAEYYRALNYCIGNKTGISQKFV